MTKKSYNLVCGKIQFMHNNECNTTDMNVIISNDLDDTNLTIKHISEIQSKLVQNLHNTLGSEEEYTVLNVVILNIIPMGIMTIEEFGGKLQENE